MNEEANQNLILETKASAKKGEAEKTQGFLVRIHTHAHITDQGFQADSNIHTTAHYIWYCLHCMTLDGALEFSGRRRVAQHWPTQRFDKLFAEGPLIVSDGQRSRLRPISLHFCLGFQFLRKYSWSTLADGISFQGTSCLLRRLLPSNEVGHLHFVLFFSNQSRRRDFVWLFFWREGLFDFERNNLVQPFTCVHT